MSAEEISRWTRTGVLAALAMLLGYAETFIPIPIPGVKLGLANIPILVALAQHDVTGAAGIAAIKVLATGLLFGSPLTLAYSAAGTLLAFAGMAPLSHLRTLRLWMLSIVGALLHEAGQLAVASLVLGTNAVWYASPLLIVAGCITGGICGALALQLAQSIPQDAPTPQTLADPTTLEPERPPAGTFAIMAALVAFFVVVFHLQSVRVLAVLALLLAVTCPADFVRTLRLTASVAIATLVLQLLVQPQTALVDCARATLRLACVSTASLAAMRFVPTHNLTGLVAWLVRPLARLGVNTSGFVLAFDVSLRMLPLLGDVLHERTFRLRDLPRIPSQLMQEVWQRLDQLAE